MNIKGLSEKEKLALIVFEQLLLEEFPGRIRRIILFGSKARGDANRHSDLDILVVISRNGKRINQAVASLTHKPIAKYMVDISPIVVEERFFKEWSPLLEHVKEDGIVVWTNEKVRGNM